MAETSAAGRDWATRYLALLGVQRETPSLPALGRLTRAHLLTVPFENVTSILRRHAHPGLGRVPSLDRETLLQTWEARAGGGVCFEVTEMFSTLLSGLGYRAYPVVGTVVIGTMTGTVVPTWRGGHQGTIVELDGNHYLVDPGNGAPFYEPVPLDRSFDVRRLGLVYRFRQHERPHHWLQERFVDGAWSPFCAFDLRPPAPGERDEAFQRHHLSDQSWVSTSLRMVRVADDAVYAIRGDTLTRYTDQGKETVTLTSDEEYERVAADVFGLPALPVLEARRALVERAPST